MNKAVRLGIWAMVLIGAVGVLRVVFSAGSDREEWMRWVPSVDLAVLQPGERATLALAGRLWFVHALTAPEVEAVHAVDERGLPHPEPLDARLLRVEIDGETRYFAAIAGASPRSRCPLVRKVEGWSSPCACARFDFVGRSLEADCPNLDRPSFVIADRKLYLRPDQPG